MNSATYYDLRQLLSCYFNQDWPDEFDSDVAAFQKIREEWPDADIAASIRQLEALLDLPLNESELESMVTEVLACDLNPAHLGLSYRQWLNRARLLLQQA